jgi:hypothetical protein
MYLIFLLLEKILDADGNSRQSGDADREQITVPFSSIWQPPIFQKKILFGNKIFSNFQIFSDFSKVEKSYLSATSAIVDCSCG